MDERRTIEVSTSGVATSTRLRTNSKPKTEREAKIPLYIVKLYGQIFMVRLTFKTPMRKVNPIDTEVLNAAPAIPNRGVRTIPSAKFNKNIEPLISIQLT